MPLPGVPPTCAQESLPGVQIEIPNENSALNKDATYSSTVGAAAAVSTAGAATGTTTGLTPRLPGNANYCHVVEACAMVGENVALAMSDGRLCHANISTVLKAGARDDAHRGLHARPEWSSWNSRHGKVLELHHSPAHDALMTLEASIVLSLRLFCRQTYENPVRRFCAKWFKYSNSFSGSTFQICKLFTQPVVWTICIGLVAASTARSFVVS